MNSGAPIDVFGVGTKLAVVADAPDLDMAYKLVEYSGKGRLKLSTKKLLYPGRKQVFRRIDGGRMAADVIGRFDEPLASEPILKPLMLRGQPAARVELAESRRRLQCEWQQLPDHLRALHSVPPPYPVSFSEQLNADLAAVVGRLGFDAVEVQGAVNL